MVPLVHRDAALRSCFLRVRELMAAKYVVEMFLPFSHFAASSMWDEMAVVMTGNGPKYPGLPARKIKHLIVELYVATKKVCGG